MNIAIINQLLARFFKGFCLALLPCLLLAIADEYATGSYRASTGLAGSIIICLSLSLCLGSRVQKQSAPGFYRREAIALVVLIWTCSSVIGALPYMLSGILQSPIDALFESVSGFTATGSTVIESKFTDTPGHYELAKTKPSSGSERHLNYYGTVYSRMGDDGIVHTGVEALPRSILLWRCLSQWLGGGGIVVLFVTLLPLAGIGSKILFQSEVSGPSKEGLTPRIKETAGILWKVYLLLSMVQWAWIMLAVPQVDWFDALTITLSTISTGGFSNYNASIGHFKNPTLEWIVLIFMMAGSINFYLFFHVWNKRFRKLVDVELILFLFIALIGSLYCGYNILGEKVEWLDGSTQVLGAADALRTGAFQFISMISSCGFATVNFDLWPSSSQAILFLAMMSGGMSGSTSGGIKVIRPYIIVRYILYRLRSLIRPDSVEVFRLHGKEMDIHGITMVLTFFSLCLLCMAISSVLFIFTGVEPITAISLTNCFLNNTGQAFRLAGPIETCAFLTPLAKLLSCFLMILGRLEYFTILVVLLPSFWKRT